MSSRRFSRLLPLLLGPLGCAAGSDTTGPCRGNATLFSCRSTDPIAVAGTAVGASVTVEGDLETCGFSDAGPYQPQPADVCALLCPSKFQACALIGNPSARDVECVTADSSGLPGNGAFGLCTGRRPAGFEPIATDAKDLSEYFSTLAALESASVSAFGILRDDLSTHGAPSDLVERAQRAMQDEVRHARTMSSFAGAETPSHVATARSPSRTLVEIAIENAAEGCVRETYGAAYGAWQAICAPDDQLRRAFASVADDEAEHADLAWDIHAWAMERLESHERAAVEAAIATTIKTLRRETRGDSHVFHALEQRLWS